VVDRQERYPMQGKDISGKERIEIEYWKTGPSEAPESDSIDNVINKITDAPNLLECLDPYDGIFKRAGSILELGAGQGWASCLLKRKYPQARFTVSDISEYAVASVPKWEHIFSVSMDGRFPCKSYAIPAEDASFDCVFAFASAHHFMAHRKSLVEIKRILKPGGHCFYFHEPSCRKWIYPVAFKRVNRLRPEVPEDVIVFPKLLAIAKETGLQAEFRFTPTLNKRQPFEFLYYFALRKIPFFQQLLPCTGTYHFTRPA
jgi:SAM-dependent methyltransferase